MELIEDCVAVGLGEELVDRHDQGWIADHAVLSVGHLGQLGDGHAAVTGLSSGERTRTRPAGNRKVARFLKLAVEGSLADFSACRST